MEFVITKKRYNNDEVANIISDVAMKLGCEECIITEDFSRKAQEKGRENR